VKGNDTKSIAKNSFERVFGKEIGQSGISIISYRLSVQTGKRKNSGLKKSIEFGKREDKIVIRNSVIGYQLSAKKEYRIQETGERQNEKIYFN
jgi:hypothetical protein